MRNRHLDRASDANPHGRASKWARTAPAFERVRRGTLRALLLSPPRRWLRTHFRSRGAAKMEVASDRPSGGRANQRNTKAMEQGALLDEAVGADGRQYHHPSLDSRPESLGGI